MVWYDSQNCLETIFDQNKINVFLDIGPIWKHCAYKMHKEVIIV